MHPSDDLPLPTGTGSADAIREVFEERMRGADRILSLRRAVDTPPWFHVIRNQHTNQENRHE
jgi:hypothetical protein